MVICPHRINSINYLGGSCDVECLVLCQLHRLHIQPLWVEFSTTDTGRSMGSSVPPTHKLWSCGEFTLQQAQLLQLSLRNESVLKSIIWSPNPTGSSARPSWTDSRLITHCKHTDRSNTEDEVWGKFYVLEWSFIGLSADWCEHHPQWSLVTWTETNCASCDHENNDIPYP